MLSWTGLFGLLDFLCLCLLAVAFHILGVCILTSSTLLGFRSDPQVALLQRETTCAPSCLRFLLILWLCWFSALAFVCLWFPPFQSRADLCPYFCLGCQLPKLLCFSDQSWHLPAHDFGKRKISALRSQSSYVCFEFDSTLGYPGEGPVGDTMSLWSANIGSFQSNPL